MTEYAGLIFAAVVCLFLLALFVGPVVKEGWDWLAAKVAQKIDHELAYGNLQARTNMKPWRGDTDANFVLRAETMPGWVWFSMHHDPPDPYVERNGWALTERQAWRALRRRDRKPLIRR